MGQLVWRKFGAEGIRLCRDLPTMGALSQLAMSLGGALGLDLSPLLEPTAFSFLGRLGFLSSFLPSPPKGCFVLVRKVVVGVHTFVGNHTIILVLAILDRIDESLVGVLTE